MRRHLERGFELKRGGRGIGNIGKEGKAYFNVAAFEALECEDEKLSFPGCEGGFGGIVKFCHFGYGEELDVG